MISGGDRSGAMLKNNGTFGFIQQDCGEEDMFTLPPFAPLGSRVTYSVVSDAKTGRPRAENVQLEGGASVAPPEFAIAAPTQQAENAVSTGGERAGTLLKDNGKFGFIQQDCGEEDMFVLAPLGGGSLPPVGTRILYDVVTDTKTGRPRAENIQPESAVMESLAQAAYQTSSPLANQTGAVGSCAGTMLKDNGKFGFIRQDGGEEDMFVLCPLGGALPPLGARVVYDVVTDAKTGRPRAENVQPEGGGHAAFAQPYQANLHYPTAAPANFQAASSSERTGTMLKNNGKFGFIQQDCGEEDMFTLPPFAPHGTRVIYIVVIDEKTGRPRADDVQLQAVAPPAFAYHSAAPPAYVQSFAGPPAQHGGARAGTLVKDNGKFGFIQQDCGEEDMFVLAPLGGVLPPLGSRIMYDVVVDAKTGRLRAENIQGEVAYRPAPAFHIKIPTLPSQQGKGMGKPAGGQRAGTLMKDNGKFGFIQQDCGEEDMFALPPMGSSFPPLGTRVLYDVVMDAKTGRPRAENLQLEGQYAGAPSGEGPMGQRTGTMMKDNGKFGFIQQDCGEEDMFTLPPFAPIGCRVSYDVVLDAKTGRPRSENVQMLDDSGGPSGGYGAAKGQGKGKAYGWPY